MRDYHESRSGRSLAEARLASELGLSPGEVIVYCPALTVMKEAAALVQAGTGLARLNDPDNAAYGEIRAMEERYAGLWRFYVFVPGEAVAKTAQAAAALFGYPSEHAVT